jgi:hypothetical protein
MRRALSSALCAVLLGAMGCVSEADAPTTTDRIADPATTSTAGTTTAGPTTSTSTTAAASSTTTTSPTTTTPPEIPVIVLDAEVRYVTAGPVAVQGWVDRLAQVTVNGLAAESDSGPLSGPGTTFWADLQVERGVNLVAVTATPPYPGVRVTRMLTVIVDPGFQEQFAYIVSVDFDAGTVTADFAEFLGGEEAVQAAREDGAIGPDAFLDNDYYIRNPDPQTRVLALAEVPVILLQAAAEAPRVDMRSVDLGTWANLIADPQSAHDLVGWWWFGAERPAYWLTLDDGIVVQVSEQYLP